MPAKCWHVPNLSTEQPVIQEFSVQLQTLSAASFPSHHGKMARVLFPGARVSDESYRNCDCSALVSPSSKGQACPIGFFVGRAVESSYCCAELDLEIQPRTHIPLAKKPRNCHSIKMPRQRVSSDMLKFWGCTRGEARGVVDRLSAVIRGAKQWREFDWDIARKSSNWVRAVKTGLRIDLFAALERSSQACLCEKLVVSSGGKLRAKERGFG